MQQLLESPLVAAPAHLDRPAVFDATAIWTWRQVHEASLVLARRLEGASAVCNLCTSRLGFLITCLAALRNRCLVVLPAVGQQRRPDRRAECEGRRAVVVGDRRDLVGALAAKSALDAARLRPTADPSGSRRRPSADELAWQPAWDEVAVLLYTSGSTGDPQPQPKTLLHLATGALAAGGRLTKEIEGGLGRVERIVCSVPPQHMFGLECSVMLPLVHGTPVLDRRPLLPADVRAAFDDAPRGAWIATPMHLRSLVQSAETVPSCSFAIVSTMPLSATRSPGRASTCSQAPVLEIYGSTETGALAMRRTARETRWRPLDGVQLEPCDGRHARSRCALRVAGEAARRARSSSATALSRCSAGRPT